MQGIVFGYATDETPQLMPLTAVLSHDLNRYKIQVCVVEELMYRKLAECRRNGTLNWVRPDCKSQVIIYSMLMT